MNLRQLLRVLQARWVMVLVTLLVTVGTTVAVSLLLPPRYTATATIVVDSKGIDPISGAVLPMMPMAGYLSTQVDIIKSHSVARRAVDLLQLADNPAAKQLHIDKVDGRGDIRDFLADYLLEYLNVEPSRESSVINISFTGNDPRFAAAVANVIVQSYITAILELKVGPARQTNIFFNEQISTLKSNLEKAQTSLSEYQRAKGIFATDERLDVETNRLNDLSSQLVAAQAQTYDSLTRQRQVQDFVARNQIPDTLPDVLSNPVVQSLKGSLTQLEVKLHDISSKVGKNHPSYQAVVAEMNGVRSKLLGEMKTISAALGNSAALAQKREDQIRSSLAAQRTKVLEMKQVRDDQAVLLREVENAQRAYDAAMGRMTQTKLESQATQTNVSVINRAVEPIDPSFPKLLINIPLAIVLGTLLGIGFALLRELSDPVVRAEADLADALGVPVLGVLDRQRRGWGKGRFLGRPQVSH